MFDNFFEEEYQEKQNNYGSLMKVVQKGKESILKPQIIQDIFEIVGKSKTQKPSLLEQSIQIRKLLNKKFGEEWHVIIINKSGQLSYSFIAYEDDNMCINFNYDGYTYLIFQTQRERKCKTKEDLQQVMHNDNQLTLGSYKLTDVSYGKSIDKEQQNIIEKLIQKFLGNQSNFYSNLRKGLNEEICQEWHIFGMKAQNYAFSVLAQDEDEYYMMFTYQTTRYALIKTPPERED